MGKKTTISIYIDEDIAKEIGLNISKLCENCLKEAIRRLEGITPGNSNSEEGIGTVDSALVRGIEDNIGLFLRFLNKRTNARASIRSACNSNMRRRYFKAWRVYY